MNTLWNIIPSVLTLVAGGGWLFDRRRHRQEVESLRADNRQKDMSLSKMYVDEFKENIADPLRHEVRELRTEVTYLRNAIQKINDCPHSDACPVYNELQKQQDREKIKNSDRTATTLNHQTTQTETTSNTEESTMPIQPISPIQPINLTHQIKLIAISFILGFLLIPLIKLCRRLKN